MPVGAGAYRQIIDRKGRSTAMKHKKIGWLVIAEICLLLCLLAAAVWFHTRQDAAQTMADIPGTTVTTGAATEPSTAPTTQATTVPVTEPSTEAPTTEPVPVS